MKQQPGDSAFKGAKGIRVKETASTIHRKHLYQPGAKTGAQESEITAPTVPAQLHTVKLPLETAFADDIEFKLVSAIGSVRAQTIKMTIVLTTTAANWHIWSAVRSIIDTEGNEYKLISFTNGASSYDDHVALNTDVPIKCTYTFGGVLPGVRTIRLFKFEYRHKSLDDPTGVEFRDIQVIWQ